LPIEPALAPGPERRISLLDVPAGTPIASAVTQIGNQFGLRVTVDAAVHGTAAVSLRDVTLHEALEAVVSRNGAAFELQGSELRVFPVRMETRTFPLDYVAISRVGSTSTVVRRRRADISPLLQQAGTVTPAGATTSGASELGGSRAASGDVVTGQSVADIWQEIRIALTGIIAAGQANGSTRPLTTTNPTELGAFSRAASVPFADGSNLVISPMSGLISVTSSAEKLAAAERFIAEFQESVLRQVMLEAKIVEVTLAKDSPFGIDWNAVSSALASKNDAVLRSDPSVTTTGNAGSVNFLLAGGASQITAVLDALQLQGDVTVLSNEQTSALNNQHAIFDVTTDEVFFDVNRAPVLDANGEMIATQSAITPHQIPVGVVLNVLPQISADDVLTMNVRPSVTNVDRVASIKLADGTTASAPVIARREGDTVVRLHAGETMIIGGLVQTRKQRTTSGTSVLQDLPLIGKAFQHTSDTETRSELVVFLTPTIISGQPVSGR
jgi:MSHA biogenesis protein MshL